MFWTKKRLKVAKGEKLITGGMNFTRGRCANVLSEVPRGKTSPDEPTPEVLDTPTQPPSDPTPFLPPVVIAGGPPGLVGGNSPVSDPGSLPFPGPGPGPAPAPVREPTTMLLLGSDLLGLWELRKKFKK
jgi:hypothetical protein